MSDKPKGSGYYAVAGGMLFVCALLGSFFTTVDLLTRQWLIRVWFLFVAVSLLYWGINRIRKTRNTDMTVGQDTISFVNGVVSTTIALLALLFAKTN